IGSHCRADATCGQAPSRRLRHRKLRRPSCARGKHTASVEAIDGAGHRASFGASVTSDAPNPGAPTPAKPSLAKSAAKGALALAIGRPVTAVLQFLGTVWLARLLTPAQFGIVGMVQVFLRF